MRNKTETTLENKTVSVYVLNGTSAHKRPFSAIQWLKAKLDVSHTYREIKRCGRIKVI